ncbi:MAG: lipopolysaccharide biosynthesis protein [Sphingomicrobium sp.]|nr:oligosaccharide flippase family protein [Sphingomonadales bacterium]
MLTRLRPRMQAGEGDDVPRPAGLSAVLQNALWLLAGKGFGAILSLGYLALATRSLGVSQFGQFVLILGLGQAIVAIVSFQTWQIVVRYGFAPLGAGDRGGVGRLLGFCTALDIAGALVGCLIAWGGTALFAPRFGWSPALTDQALLFCIVMLLSIRSTPVGILRLFDRFGVGAVADSATSVARLVGALIVVHLGASLTGFLIAWAVAEVVTAASYWSFAIWIAGPSLRRVRGFGKAPAEHPGLLRFAAVTNLSATLGTISNQVAVLLVGLVAGPAAAGGYRLAYQLGQSLARISDMVARSMFAELTRAVHANEAADLKRLFRQSSRLAYGAAVVIVAVLFLIGKPALVMVAGPAYASSYPLLVLLGTAAALDLGGVSFEPTLMATGHAGVAFRLRLAKALVLLGLLAVLMPRIGALGAALAMAGGSAIGLALFGASARHAVYGSPNA